jgi:gamma-glutamylcyclotransferase (GGCT)/AIG2-like uncharacterized protein YtfP
LIFVYGTLRPPRPGTAAADSRFYPHIAPYIRSATPACLPDAELYNLGAYPALKPGQGVVYGDLLEVEPVVVEITDRIEGHPHFYRRAEVKVQLENDSTAAAWVYWAPRGITLGRPRIGCGDWFQRRTENCQDLATPAYEPLPEEAPVEATLQALVRRFAESDCSWLSSIRSDGRAHGAPVWHVWHQSRIYVVTTSKAVKTANIQENPSVVMTHPDPMNPIIIEGWAALSLIAQQQLQPLFAAKYDWDINTSPEYDTIIEVVPIKLIAWGKYGEGRWTGSDLMRVWSF